MIIIGGSVAYLCVCMYVYRCTECIHIHGHAYNVNRKWICMLVILYTLRVYCLNPGFIREYWRCSFSATAAASELAWRCHPHIIYRLWIVVTMSAFFDSCQSFPIAYPRRLVDGAGRTPCAPDGCSVPYLACRRACFFVAFTCVHLRTRPRCFWNPE